MKDIDIDGNLLEPPVKRPRGRPKKEKTGTGEQVKRPRGRPRKEKPDVPKRPRGRPRKGTETGLAKRGTGSKAKKGTGKEYKMSPDALIARRKANGSLPARTPEEKDYNTALINHALRVHEIAIHADLRDPVSLQSCFAAYVKLCQEDGFKVGNLGAAAAMGVDLRTLYRWRYSPKEEYKKLAEFVMSICAMSRENMIQDNKLNPVIGIFHQRNFDGLRNDTEQVQPIAGDQIETETTHEVLEKYGYLLEE